MEESEVKKGPGRPSKKDQPSIQGQQNIEMAKEERTRRRKKKSETTEVWFELVAGKKLIMCKKTKSGSVYRSFQGSLDDKKHGAEIKRYLEKIKNDGLLRHRF
jgi:hypothetical protein